MTPTIHCGLTAPHERRSATRSSSTGRIIVWRHGFISLPSSRLGCLLACYEVLLMRNSSQNAGRILRLPASHSCHPRRVQWMSAAAAVCESPAASRAARTSAGVGFAAGPFGPLFGWLVMLDDGEIRRAISRVRLGCVVNGKVPISAGEGAFDFRHIGAGRIVFGAQCGNFRFSDLCGLDATAIVDFEIFGHFLLQPLLPRGAVEKQYASHELHYTRNACKCKNYFEIFSLGTARQGR